MNDLALEVLVFQSFFSWMLNWKLGGARGGSRSIDKFQSFFSWMLNWKFIISSGGFPVIGVSILL